VWLAAERFRARYGRAPEREELRNVKLENRQAKMPQSRPELQQVWEQRAAGQGVDRGYVESLQIGTPGGVQRADERGWRERVTGALSAQGATFGERELRAVRSYTATGPRPARCAALCRMSPLVEVTNRGPSQQASVGAITLRVFPALGGPTAIAAQSAGVRNMPPAVCPAHT